QTIRDSHAPGAAGRRSKLALRQRFGGLSDALSRPSFDHDRAAHALHRRRRAPDLGLPRPCWRLDGSAPVRPVGTDARVGGGIFRWLRRDGATEEVFRRGPFSPQNSRICWRACARSVAKPARPSRVTLIWLATA